MIGRRENLKLTKSEKETIILFNETEDQVNIYTYNVSLKRRLANFSKKYPELCRRKEVNKQGGVTYLIDKARVSLNLIPPYDVKRIETVIQNLPIK
jgi:hypothetical protein